MFTDGQKSVLIALLFVVVVGSMLMVNKEINLRKPPRPPRTVTSLDVISELLDQRSDFIRSHNNTSSTNQRATALEGVKATDAAIVEIAATLGVSFEAIPKTAEVLDVE